MNIDEGNIMTTHNITTATRTPNRKITRFTKVVTALIISPFLIAALAGVAIGVAHSINPPATVSQVSNFNDGFATSKQDDCEQGSAYACEWLNANHMKH
jgi:hypothetical protein